MFLIMMIFFVFPTNYTIIATKQSLTSEKVITFIMVAYDVVAFITGLVFGFIMKLSKLTIKYFAPILFWFSYFASVISTSMLATIIALLLGGIANGIAVPYINTIASIIGEKML